MEGIEAVVDPVSCLVETALDAENKLAPGCEVLRPDDHTHVSDDSQTSVIVSFLTKDGAISQEQLEYARRVHAKLTSRRSLLSVIKELNFITTEKLRETLKRNLVSLRIGTLLVELGYLSEEDIKAALAIQHSAPVKKRLGDVLVEANFISESKLVETLAFQLGFPHIEPNLSEIDRTLLPRGHIRNFKQHNFIPVARENGHITVVFGDPTDQRDIEAAQQLLGKNIVPAIASRRAIAELLAGYERSFLEIRGPAPAEDSAVAIVNQILEEAMIENASDIHIEPFRDRQRVRFRRDGVLVHHKYINPELANSMVSRLKVMAAADISERMRHQDGRFLYEDLKTGRSADVRASFFITIFGEKVVLRLLTKQQQVLSLKDIGMTSKMLERFTADALDMPSGVILITGPTGSGKTTTLYSCVAYLNDVNTSIITAEEPVEYVVDGISQCAINPKIGRTFEETLRHMVRQDPDVIILGEIRDKYSADTAIQAALTGHKILSTFHTEDSIGGLLRLLNMDIEAFLISSTVVSVLAQRLIRRICPHCAIDYTPTPGELRRVGYSPHDIIGATFKIGEGCRSCRYTGYKGRVGAFELLILNEAVKDAILSKKTSYEIRRLSVQSSGLVTLLEDGLAKAATGQALLHDVIRLLPRLMKPRPIQEIRRLSGEE
ncbi:MAG: Flp pilus assembly complex ATPase component TadA [Deltaproteobacteria bacterium]|nr:Flp pilus assembly complex ATPase component TadA [Deltaproteobacteria bacterium]